MQHCFHFSRKSLRFLGSAMGIAIADRKNRCDLLRFRCAKFLFQSNSRQLKSVSVTATIIVINSDRIKVGNGNWKSVIWKTQASLRQLVPYLPIPRVRRRGQKGMLHRGFLKDFKGLFFSQKGAVLPPPPRFPPTMPLEMKSLPNDPKLRRAKWG